MNEFKEMRLTGGSFFTLIIKGCYEKLSNNEKTLGNTDPMSNKSIMFGLIKICDPKFNTSLIDNRSMIELCSRYKNCDLTYSQTYLPFNDDSTAVLHMRRAFSYNPLNIYARTKTFVKQYIDLEGKGIELASALRSLIILDKSISDNELIYIDSKNGKYISKKDLIDNYKEIDMVSIIAGVWYYLIDKQIDNTLGKSTVNSWYPKGKNSTMKCDIWHNDGSIMLKGIQNDIVDEYIEEENGTSQINDNGSEDINENIEFVENKKEEESKDSSPKGLNINFNGSIGNININNGTINNNYYNDKEDKDGK